jgi:hypothetical protein
MLTSVAWLPQASAPSSLGTMAYRSGFLFGRLRYSKLFPATAPELLSLLNACREEGIPGFQALSSSSSITLCMESLRRRTPSTVTLHRWKSWRKSKCQSGYQTNLDFHGSHS